MSGWGLLSDGGKAAKKLQEVDLEVLRHPHFFFSLTQAPLSDNLDETVQRRLPLQEKLDIFKDDVHFQVGYNPS